MGKSQRKYYEEYVALFNVTLKKKSKLGSIVGSSKAKRALKGNHHDDENFHHDISIESQTIKQEDDFFRADLIPFEDIYKPATD